MKSAVSFENAYLPRPTGASPSEHAMKPHPSSYAGEPPLDHRELLARVRFSLDQPIRPTPETEREFGEATRSAISQTRRTLVRVTAKLLPEVYKAVQQASERLMLANAPDVFIEADPCANACALIDGDRYVITVNSGLVTLLEPDELPFVIGHEIGHAGFRHGSAEPESEAQALLLLESRRAQEISADRAGLLSVDDPKSGLRAGIKVACGLGSPFLSRRLDAFIEQLSTPSEDEDATWEAESDHPDLALRYWAQQRFLDSDVYHALTGKHGGCALADIEREIEDRFLSAGSSAAFRVSADKVHEALAWLGVLIVSDDENVTETERTVLVELVGRIWADDATIYAKRHGLDAVRRRAIEALQPLRFTNARPRERVESALVELGDRIGREERAREILQMIRKEMNS